MLWDILNVKRILQFAWFFWFTTEQKTLPWKTRGACLMWICRCVCKYKLSYKCLPVCVSAFFVLKSSLHLAAMFNTKSMVCLACFFWRGGIGWLICFFSFCRKKSDKKEWFEEKMQRRKKQSARDGKICIVNENVHEKQSYIYIMR